MKALLKLQLLSIIVIIAFSCNKDPKPIENISTMEKLNVPESFNWSTARPVTLSILALDNQDDPLSNVKFSIFTAKPTLGGRLIVSGMTNQNGKYEVFYEVPSYYSSLYISTDYLGLNSGQEVALSETGFNIVVGGSQTPTKDTPVSMLKSNTTFKFMGTYNSNGVPNYLEPANDPITADFLADINNTLPERVSLPTSHPEYFSNEYYHNLDIVETCDVWITFVHEGAGYRNVLAYYKYPTGSRPATPSAIDSLRIIFPNASLLNSGGGLVAGNKVYLGRFTANTTIAWALIADGWKGSVTTGNWMVYSDKNLNPATQPELKQQTVFLYDPGRSRLLLGVEDIRRNASSGCDHDFNDAVFFVTANPIQAINISKLPIIDYIGVDDDNDGVNNNFDDYPHDAAKAFDNWFFNEGNYGTLAFEDLWPYRGDYDFNDAVVDYNFNQITNGNNDVVELDATFILRAHGANYHNGFGFELPITSNLVASISGTMITDNLLHFNANGTEAGQTNAVIMVWDDSYKVLEPQSGTMGANTILGITYVTPVSKHVVVHFINPVPMNQLGIPPFNPFIFVNQERGVEVHLPNKAPTALADMTLFGTGHDNSIPGSGRYYKTQNNLPWAINIIELFDYPIEKTEVTAAHLHFATWAESGGALFADWYHNNTNYRNSTKIYTPTP